MNIHYGHWDFKRLPIAITQDNYNNNKGIAFAAWAQKVNLTQYTVAIFRFKPTKKQ